MGVLMLTGMTLCYLLLYVLFPYICVGYLFTGEKRINAWFYSLVVGNFYTILVVYILFFLGIFNVYTLVLSLVLFAIGVQFIGGKRRIDEIKIECVKTYALLKNKQWRFKTLFINLKLKYLPKREKKKLHVRVIYIILTILTLATIGYGLYVRMYSSITVSYFGVSDVYIHLDWLRDMQDGIIFANGVYPFGFHNLIIAYETIFNFNIVAIMQFWGAISFIMILSGVLFIVSKLFKSPVSRLVAIWIFCASDIFVYFRYTDYRFSEALPQEYALIFALPAVIFLHEYLTKHKKLSLIFTSLCFSLTVLIHFYATIFLCLAFVPLVILSFKAVFKLKTLVSLIAAFMLATVIAVAPIGVGLLKGIPFERSIGWALGTANTLPSNSIESENYGDNYYATKIPEGTPLLESIGILARDEFRGFLFPDRDIVEQRLINDIDKGYLLKNGANKYALPMLISLASALILIAIGLKRRYKNVNLQIWFVLFCGILFSLSIAYQLGFPQIIVLVRQRILLRFMIVPIFGFLPELIYRLSEDRYRLGKQVKWKAFKGLSYIALTAIVLIIGYDSLVLKHLASKTISLQADYEQTVKAIARIKDEYKRKSYTIVATTHELALVRGDGFHYELIKLLKPLEGTDPLEKQYIPTENVFVFIEKTVLPVYRVVDYSNPEFHIHGEKISLEQAKQPLPNENDARQGATSELFYVNPKNRKIIMSKAYYWANEYKKYYPNEMTVYYEDEDIVIYHLKQDPYALNDLSMDYGF